MFGLVPFAPAVADSLAVGAGAVCGALCRHHVGKFAADSIAKDPSLKYLSGEVCLLMDIKSKVYCSNLKS
jgi:F0F1-type ATP synthase membrane subunit c/vacuolar-type H+-ATPase subunit K